MAETATLEVTMPEMGESVTEGTVLEWHVAVGDWVDEGDTLVEVSTDKVDAEVPAPASGTVTRLAVEPDEDVTVGALLAELETGGTRPEGSTDAPETGSNGTPAAAPAVNGGPAGDDSGNGHRATPIARRVAAAAGVDLGAVDGSGSGGKVTKADVIERGNGGPAGSHSTALRGAAGTLARAMDESREIPTATSFRTIPVDRLDAGRRALNSALAERGVKLSFTHLVAWAIVSAVRDWPVMARHFDLVDDKPHVIDDGRLNFGLAIDLERDDRSRTLVVPSVKGADRLDFAGFHSAYEDLVARARDNELTADDFAGTNLTLTNPGGIGTVASVPRLMKGQGTIIATGSIAYPPEWSEADPDQVRALGVSKVMTMTSTYDHRIIQGAESGNFLKAIAGLLTDSGFYEGVAADLGIDPAAVSAATAQATRTVAPASVPVPATVDGVAQPPTDEMLQAVQAATSLLKAYRTHGHLAADLDPLGNEPKGDPALDPETVHLTPELMSRIPASILRIGVPGETLLEALPRMKAAYTSKIGYQFEHLSSHQQRVWMREKIETGAFAAPLEPEEKVRMLERLIDVFEFERFIEKAYLGQKIFSIEGLDVMVPMLDEISTLALRDGAGEIVLGMAHRGRLSVLAHNVGRPIESLFAEFEGSKRLEDVKAVAAIPHGGTGDVKYHYGHEGTYRNHVGEEIAVHLYPNPSHLESVNPVVTGAARFSQNELEGTELEHDTSQAVPVLIHGDAAFPGQGVVAETLNLLALDGYSVGGTIHLVSNNQIGFTTDPIEARSTPYATDMAKGFNIPIIHVNADDVEACSQAIRLAMAYRREWQRDVVIDVIGYRRYGHNETDEPAYTQPLMAERIKSHPPVSELYAGELETQGIITREKIEATSKERRDGLRATLEELREKMEAGVYEDPTVTSAGTSELNRGASPPVTTAVPEERLRALNEALIEVPDGFSVQRKLRKPLSRRLEALEEGGIDFAQAEALAFASLLEEGVHLRLTGQDSERGTFSQRHLVLHDEKDGETFAPIQNLPQARAPFELYNSPLSEAGCLGFEYGYSSSNPDSLVLWEAQFGDFANSGQVIIDTFIASGEAKWGLTTRLTLLLPHGHEGAGPEHSSARMERFLSLAAEGNMRIANPSTAAQYFHLLRRQALIEKPRPLVVFTPKGLLRQAAAAARLDQLANEHFHFILEDQKAVERKDEIRRLVLCSGRIYYDLDASEAREAATDVAVGRIELLYPFAEEQLQSLIESYPNLEEIVWVQEEPRNQGAWSVMRRRLPELLPEGVRLEYIGRQGRASPGEGYSVTHVREQERIVLTALTRNA
jgi:2-oxoglutarate decarboxylase